MAENWGKFWKRGNIEWSKESIINSNSMKELLKLIKSFFRKKNLNGIETLEIGAGVGLASYFLYYNGAKVTLVDSSREAKKEAEKWWGDGKYDYRISDLFKYNEKKYDIVLSFGLCEHFKGREREIVLRRHLDLLKSRGIGIISVPYKYGIFYRVGKFIAEITGLWSFGDEFPFSKKELIDFAEKNNLKYKLKFGGFYSSAYDLFVRKPLKLMGIRVRRRFDDSKSVFDFLGSSVLLVFEKENGWKE